MDGDPRGARVPTAVVIDDDADLRDLLKAVLSQAGYEVVLAGTAYDGVEAVRTFAPEVTLLDLSMPGMDGFAAARRIREITNDIVIVVSGWDSEMDIVQALAAGADSYIVKPFKTRELRARVEALVRRARAIRAQAQGGAATDIEGGEPAEAGVPATAPERQVTDPGRLPETSGPVSGPASAAMQPATNLVFSARDESVWKPGMPTIVQAPSQNPVVEEPAATAALMTATEEVRDFEPGHVLRHNGLVLDKRTNEVKVHGSPVALANDEFALLAALMEHGRQVRSTASLVLALRGESYVTTYHVSAADRRAVVNTMKSLRRKLGDSENDARWIEDVHGVGYRMSPQ